MDKTLNKRVSKKQAGRPVIVFANWYQFGPGERTVRPCVESRMFLWCVSGSGTIRVNGAEFAFGPGVWTLLPWEHEVIYQANARHPFFVGGIHLIPWHARSSPVVFQVAHQKTDALARHPARRNVTWKNMDKVITSHFYGEKDRLALLAAYIVETFQHGGLGPDILDPLTELFLREIRVAAAGRPLSDRPKPLALRQMQTYAQTRLDRLLSVDDLAQIGQCSPATVHRLFRAFESVSPGEWMARLRVERAAFLLRTTRLPVREVGEQVGLPDPFHFSRFFKREMGLSPRAYQQSRRFF